MLLKDMNDNPLSRAYKKRLAEQPIEVQKKIKALDDINSKEYQLRVIKRSRKAPQTGDIFLINPREGVYFYGRVLKSDIDHITKDVFIHGKSVVFIFKCKTNTLDLPHYQPDYENLLMGPEIIDASYWRQGYFYTIANLPLNEDEKKLDYGFYSIGKGKYFKENGEEMDHVPHILGTYGIATIIKVAIHVEKEFLIDPTLLEF